MRLYFTTRQIPQLRDLPLQQRIKALEAAASKMTVPERSLLNILKLLVIVPVFVFILQTATSWLSLVWAGLFLLLYPLLIKPIQYSLCAKYLPSTNKEVE